MTLHPEPLLLQDLRKAKTLGLFEIRYLLSVIFSANSAMAGNFPLLLYLFWR